MLYILLLIIISPITIICGIASAIIIIEMLKTLIQNVIQGIQNIIEDIMRKEDE